jgi:threonine/homoserine/homoserine lactone efflux protein
VIDTSTLLPFIASSLVIILSPGADTFLLLRFAIRGGPRAGLSAMLGILAGLSLMSLVLISGMGLLISRTPWALGVVNLLGITVLVFLAGISIRSGLGLWRLQRTSQPEPTTIFLDQDRPFRMSLLTNVTNPKVLIFYLAFFPQFLGNASSAVLQLTLLSGAFLVVTILWLVPLVFGAARARAFFLKPQVAIGMEFSVAAVFLVLAIILAVTL